MPSDAAARERGLGVISLVPSPQSKEDALARGEEASKAPALQEFGSSHPRANELGAAQTAGALRAPAAAFSRTHPARRGRLLKASVVLFVILVPLGFVSLVGTKEPPLLAFRDWSGSDRTAAPASLWSQDRALHSAPARRLAIHEARGMPGEALRIGTALEGVTKDAVVMVTGLIPGMTLSTGSAIGANAWRVPATEFVDTWIGPPTDFSGAIDVTVELHLPDQSIADRRRLRLEWAAPTVLASADPTISPEPAAPAPSAHQAAPRLVEGSPNSARAKQGPDTIASTPLETGVNSMSAAGDPTVVMQSPSVPPVPAHAMSAVTVASANPSLPVPGMAGRPASSAIPQSPQVDQEQIAILVERGKGFIASGDLAAARVVLRRAAESKDASAALALGSTYDPIILRDLKVVGFAPDIENARGWYEKAREFGSEEAQRRIQILARQERNQM